MTFYIAAIDISFNNFVMKQMVISQLKDVRTASKAFSTAQSSAMQVQKKLASEAKIPTTTTVPTTYNVTQDLVKWGLKDENRAIQDAVTQVSDKNAFQSQPKYCVGGRALFCLD